ETVSASQLSAHSLVARLEKQIAVMSSSSAELAEAVRKRGRITFDMKELQRHVAGLLDQRLQRAVEAPVARLEKALGGRIDAVGAEEREAGERAEAGRKRGRITFDMKELQRHVAGLLDQRLQRAVEAPVARLEKALGGRIDAVGAEAREAGERAEAASKQAARSIEASASSIE